MIDNNIYILLEIEPNTTDTTFLMQAVDKKIAEWNGKMNANMQLAQQKVKALVAIKDNIQKTPSFLAKEMEDAIKYLEVKRKEELKELVNLAKLMVINGQIDEKNLETLKKKFKAYSETEILKIIQAKKKQQKVFKYKGDGIELTTTFNSLVSQINKNLEIIKKNTLYEFLNLSPTSSSQELIHVSSKIEVELRTYSEKTPERTAMASLCSQVKQVFENDLNRRSYDKCLKERVFKDIESTLVDIAKNTKIITPQQYNALLDMCLERKIDIHYAEYYLYQTCEKRKYVIIEDINNDMQDIVSCRFCAYPNDKKQRNCISCGMPLTIECPSCKQISDSENELKCRNCGFDIGSIPNAFTTLKNAEDSLSKGDIPNSERWILATKRYWSTMPALTQIEQRLEKLKKEQHEQLNKINKLRTEKRYFELLNTLKIFSAINTEQSLEIEAYNAIKNANHILSQAKGLTDHSGKIDLYMQALSICADLEDAKKELKINPPQAPSSLKATVIGSTVRLSWDKLRSTYINYSVIRKVNGIPQNPSDGETIAILADNRFDDTNAIPGLSYYYAVYSKCVDIYSINGIAEGPIITVCEINNSLLKYDIQEKHINFSCQFPKNAKAIEVFRNNTLIKTLSSENFLDSGLLTERVYSYRFVAIYEDCIGKRYRTNGVEVQLKPTAPPKAVELKVSSSENKAIISWVNPDKGILEIYHSDKPFSENKNDLVNTDSFKGEKILVSGTSRVINKDFNGVRYYLPLTVSGKIGVVGQQVMITSILEPEKVSIDKVNEQNIDVTWKWNNGIDAVKIRSQIDGGSFMDADIHYSQTLSPKFTLSIPKDSKSIKVAVMTLFKSHSAEILLSKPIEKFFNLQTAMIDFVDVRRVGFFSKNKYEITLKTNMPISSDLHLLIREGLPPNNLINYQSYLTIPAKDIKESKSVKYMVEYERMDRNKAVIFRLIPADKTQLNSIVIIPEVKQVK